MRPIVSGTLRLGPFGEHLTDAMNAMSTHVTDVLSDPSRQLA
jgi:hypothetical protein